MLTWDAIAGVPSIGSLDILISELERIEGQQHTLRDAVEHNRSIVVHPRKEARMTQPLSKTSSQHRHNTCLSAPDSELGLKPLDQVAWLAV